VGPYAAAFLIQTETFNERLIEGLRGYGDGWKRVHVPVHEPLIAHAIDAIR
jgi:hypothetical protein